MAGNLSCAQGRNSDLLSWLANSAMPFFPENKNGELTAQIEAKKLQQEMAKILAV